ncbi:MAG: hypothetical protein RJA98_3325 [Pseudomonadota bacterium]|jgi:iron complex outermembrane receptor protein
MRRPPTPLHRRPALLISALLLAPTLSHAQTDDGEGSASRVTREGPVKPVVLPRVVVTAQREQAMRRLSTASKLVVGRDEIEAQGDSSISDVLKRLPGVTIGSDGDPRLRGLGNGYTQVLINGEAMPRGFTLDALSPSQVERIEVQRAPTADTGAQAIAGTLNIILRETLATRAVNELQLGSQLRDGELSPGVSWTRGDTLSAEAGSAYTLSLNAFHSRSRWESIWRTSAADAATGAPTRQREITGSGLDVRDGLHLHGRLQARPTPDDTLSIQPFWMLSQGDNTGVRAQTQSLPAGAPPWSQAGTSGSSRFANLRINTQWQHVLSETRRMEVKFGVGGFSSRSSSLRTDADANGAALRALDDHGEVSERSASFSGKVSDEGLAEGHTLVAGWDLAWARRHDQRTLIESPASGSSNTQGDDLRARSTKLAVYAQDEWQLTPQWQSYAGLRWESIATRSDAAASPVNSVNSVWSPLLHAVWKADPKSRDQVRVSLTRSFRAPSLRQLTAQPSLSAGVGANEANQPTAPDRVGNPLLKPELATGLDVSFERYLSEGGVLSVSVFHRQINDLIRTVASLETTPWSSVQRWVSRPSNFGRATTQGVEFEAKAKVSDLIDGGPALPLRANLSLYRSRVSSVNAADNRLDDQPQATANLGTDVALSSVPLTLGGTLNWTPAYWVAQSDTQRVHTGTRRSLDAYALWTFSPAMKLRLSASNLLPIDRESSSTALVGSEIEQLDSRSSGVTQWALRWELKL